VVSSTWGLDVVRHGTLFSCYENRPPLALSGVGGAPSDSKKIDRNTKLKLRHLGGVWFSSLL
jgi:hypothetical protein